MSSKASSTIGFERRFNRHARARRRSRSSSPSRPASAAPKPPNVDADRRAEPRPVPRRSPRRSSAARRRRTRSVLDVRAARATSPPGTSPGALNVPVVGSTASRRRPGSCSRRSEPIVMPRPIAGGGRAGGARPARGRLPRARRLRARAPAAGAPRAGRARRARALLADGRGRGARRARGGRARRAATSPAAATSRTGCSRARGHGVDERAAGGDDLRERRARRRSPRASSPPPASTRGPCSTAASATGRPRRLGGRVPPLRRLAEAARTRSTSDRRAIRAPSAPRAGVGLTARVRLASTAACGGGVRPGSGSRLPRPPTSGSRTASPGPAKTCSARADSRRSPVRPAIPPRRQHAFAESTRGPPARPRRDTARSPLRGADVDATPYCRNGVLGSSDVRTAALDLLPASVASIDDDQPSPSGPGRHRSPPAPPRSAQRLDRVAPAAHRGEQPSQWSASRAASVSSTSVSPTDIAMPSRWCSTESDVHALARRQLEQLDQLAGPVRDPRPQRRGSGRRRVRPWRMTEISSRRIDVPAGEHEQTGPSPADQPGQERGDRRRRPRLRRRASCARAAARSPR